MFTLARSNVCRKVADALNLGTPEEAIGKIWPGMELAGIFKGQYTLFKLAEHILEQTGPCSLVVSTWAAKTSEMDHSWELLDSRHITGARWIVDKSFPNRQPAYYQRLLETFGPSSVVFGKCHLKVLAIKNQSWNIVIRSSMNMSPKIQMQAWDISDSAEFMALVENLVDHLVGDTETQEECQRRGRKRIEPKLAYGQINGAKDWARFG